MDERTLGERIAVARESASAAPPRHPEVALWRTATDADIDAIHAVTVAAERIDHPTWTTPREDIADTFDLPHIDQSRDTIMAFDAEGRAVAFGSSFLHPSRDGALTVHLSGAVRPELWRRGIGTEVFGWQVARALEQLADVAPTLPTSPTSGWTAELTVFAEEPNTGHRRLAEAHGFTASRWFATMLRDMAAAAPEITAPAGIRVVSFTHDRDDDARLARNDAFRDHWGSLPTQPASWAKFVGGEFFRPDLSRLALDADGAIVAFCLASVNEDDWTSLGATNAYIDLIGVVRSHRRRGLAPLVVSHTLRAIADAGLQKAVLDVDTASPTGADALYVGLGFTAAERAVALVRSI